jgi:type I restriction enzyme S subunit
MTGSSGRQRVQEECFDKYRIAVAPSSLMDAFDGLTSASFEQIRNLRQQNEKLLQARGLLLPRIMDGRISI